jgi:hypothetical protein
MMISNLLQKIESYGVTLKAEGGQIFYKPKEALPQSIVDCIRKEKDQIILYLQSSKNSHNFFSHVLVRAITISWNGSNPKVVYVNCVPYTTEEISKLKKADSEEVRAAHLLKEIFDGKIIEYCKNKKKIDLNQEGKSKW